MTALRGSALCLAAIGCASAFLALHLGLRSAGVVEAGLFPFIAAMSLLLTSVGVAVSETPEASETEPADRARLLRYGIAIGSFAIAMKLLGTILATICLVAGILRWVEQKSWSTALAAGVGLAMLSWWVFDRMLGVPLPQGLWEIG